MLLGKIKQAIDVQDTLPLQSISQINEVNIFFMIPITD
jgi:hypothetical protein